ncbi:MAG: IPTL-CTERM sorting domain-containing protein [Thermoanaerobaculia bacterium]
MIRRSRLRLLLLCLVLLPGAPAFADITGFVRVDGSGTPGTPVAGAWVKVQADLATPGTFSGADGSFVLSGVPAGPLTIAASVPYLRSAPTNFLIGVAPGADGDSGVDIRLKILPAADNPAYVPADTSECGACHFERYSQWATSHHAMSGQNVWVRDLFSGDGTAGGSAGYVFKTSHDAGETGFCATCHASMQDIRDPRPQGVPFDEVDQQNGIEGIHCTTCHQLDSIDEGNINALHYRGKATYRFPVGGPGVQTHQFVWGPMNDVSFDYMQASHSVLHTTATICASCHQYHNPDTDAPGQNTYLEWTESFYAQPGPGYRVCQDCHQPALTGLGTNCEFGGAARDGAERHAHTFIGSTPETLAENIALTTTAEFGPAGTVLVTSSVDNFGAGHSFPTGVSVRNAILSIEATLDGQPLAQLSGPTIPFWGSDDVPGDQPGDLAGRPGKGFAKVLEGRINGTGPVVRPVLFIDAEAVYSDTLIPSGAIDTSTVEFALPDGFVGQGVVDVTATLIYRRGWRALAVTKGWTVDAHGGPIEIEVARNDLSVDVVGGTVLEIPTLSPGGLLALALLLLVVAMAALRRSAATRT